MSTEKVQYPKLVSIVYVEWGSVYRQRSLGELLRCIPSMTSLELVDLIIVDNKQECTPIQPNFPRKGRVIPGSNKSREFSGWDEGVLELKKHGRLPDVLVLCNDTFAVHRRPRALRRRRIGSWIRHLADSNRAESAGQLDPLATVPIDSPFGLITEYYSTYVFALNSSAVERTFPLHELEMQIDRLLSVSSSERTLFASDLVPKYWQILERWLHDKDGWSSAAPLTPKNFEFMRLKAKSILYEHGLTNHMRSQGILINDLTSGRGVADCIEAVLARIWFFTTKQANIWIKMLLRYIRSH